MNQTIKNKLQLLPNQPGCYLMKDNQGKIIYVGKAKLLKNRVRSYFIGSHDGKTLKLINEIVDFEFILTSSNIEALILEMNLIKRYDPKYNIRLKDVKSYPFIKITSERHPRLIITREVKKDKGKYFGPFPNVQAANETKKVLEQFYPLRKCPTSSDRACLSYQMGQCIGPCVRDVSEEEYKNVINKIVRFFHGGYKVIKKELTAKMDDASLGLDFEKAKDLRDKISCIEATIEKQSITTADFKDRDVVGYDYQNDWMCIQVFFIRQGKMLERNTSIFPIYDDPESTFLSYLGQFYSEPDQMMRKEIFLPLTVNKNLAEQLLHVNITQPIRGQKKELVKLACKNARVALQERFSLSQISTDPKNNANRESAK